MSIEHPFEFQRETCELIQTKLKEILILFPEDDFAKSVMNYYYDDELDSKPGKHVSSSSWFHR